MVHHIEDPHNVIEIGETAHVDSRPAPTPPAAAGPRWKSVNMHNFRSKELEMSLRNKSGVGRRVARKRAWADFCGTMLAINCYVQADGGNPPEIQPPGGLDGREDEDRGTKRRRVEVNVEKSTVGQQLQLAKGDIRKLWGAPDDNG